MGYISMTDIEHIKETENTIEVFESDIDLYINLWCEKQNISPSDIITISQNRFNALLYYIYQNVFKNADLKSKQVYNTGLFDNCNYNAYNIELIESLCDVYISLCDFYDKIINVEGFSRFIGIRTETIYEWGRDEGKKASSRTSDIAKRLISERERTLSDRLASGVKNPVGVLGCLNHWHNWAGVGNMEVQKPRTASLADIQKQAGLLSDNSSVQGMETAKDRLVELSDNSHNLEKPVK